MNLSFKYGDLSKIPEAIEEGVVYFSKDDNKDHSLRGYLNYDMNGTRIPIIGAGYYISKDRQLDGLDSIFIENNLFNIDHGAIIGVGGLTPGELWLYKSNKTPTTTDRGLWCPLILQGTDNEIKTDSGEWIIKAGKDLDFSNLEEEYLYLGSPNYLKTNEEALNKTVQNTYTIRPVMKDIYNLGDLAYKWKNLYIHTVNAIEDVEVKKTINKDIVTTSITTDKITDSAVTEVDNIEYPCAVFGLENNYIEENEKFDLLKLLLVSAKGNSALLPYYKGENEIFNSISLGTPSRKWKDAYIYDTVYSQAISAESGQFSNTLTVEGSTFLQDTLTVVKEASLDGGLKATSGSFTSTLNVSGAVSLKDTLDVTGLTTLKDELKVVKATHLQDILTVDGKTTLKDTLILTNKAYLNGGLETTSGKLTSTLTVGGATSLQDTLTVVKKSNLDGGLSTTTGTFSSTLNVSGKTTLSGGMETTSGIIVIDKSDTENNTGINCQGNKIIIAGACTGSDEHPELVIGDVGPQILFSRYLDQAKSGNQKIALIYTTHDNVFSGNSLSLTTTEAEGAFISPVLIAKNRIMTSAINASGNASIGGTLSVTGKLTAKGGVDITSTSTYVRDEMIVWGPSSEKDGTSLVYGDSGPKLIFSSRKDQSDSDNQKIQLIYTNASTGAGLALVSNVAAYFVAPKFIGPLTGNVTGNASTATKLQTARTFSVGNQSGSFDGSNNLSLAITAAMSCTDGTSGSPQLGITVNGVSSSKVTIPTASKTAYGVVTTGAQTFAGGKTFSSGLSSTTGSFSSTVSVSGKLTANGGLSSTTGSFSSTVSVSGQLTASGGLQVYGLTDVDSSKLSGRLRIGESWKDMLLMDTNEIVHIEQANSSDTTPSIGKLFITSKGGLDGGYIKFINPNSAKTTVTYQGGHLTADSTNKYGSCINVQWTVSGDTRSNYSAMLIRQSAEKAAWCATHEGLDTGDTHVYLGTKDRLWSTVYAKNGQISSSDVRLKDIQDQFYLEKALEMYDNLTPISFKWKNLSKNSNYDRIHIGLQAQQVEELLNSKNLKATEMSLLCIDSINLDETPGYKNVITDGKVYSLRYSEFHGLHILKNQQQDARLTELENKNKELENTIATLKTQIELLKLAMGG